MSCPHSEVRCCTTAQTPADLQTAGAGAAAEGRLRTAGSSSVTAHCSYLRVMGSASRHPADHWTPDDRVKSNTSQRRSHSAPCTLVVLLSTELQTHRPVRGIASTHQYNDLLHSGSWCQITKKSNTKAWNNYSRLLPFSLIQTIPGPKSQNYQLQL